MKLRLNVLNVGKYYLNARFVIVFIVALIVS